MRTTGVDLPLSELETAVSAKKDMQDRGETSFGLHIPVQFETFYHVHGLLFPKAGTGKHKVLEFLSF